METSHSRLGSVLAVFEQLGIEVREEALGGSGGGLCRLRGRSVLFLDSQADAASRCAMALAALKSVPELDGMYLPPFVREALESGPG